MKIQIFRLKAEAHTPESSPFNFPEKPGNPSEAEHQSPIQTHNITAIYTNREKCVISSFRQVHRRVEISHGLHHFLNKTPNLHQRIPKAGYAVTENVEKLPAAKTLQSRI